MIKCVEDLKIKANLHHMTHQPSLINKESEVYGQTKFNEILIHDVVQHIQTHQWHSSMTRIYKTSVMIARSKEI